MLIYWIAILYGYFSAKIVFSLAVEKTRFFFFCLPIVITPLAFVAGCRDLCIGIDLETYGLAVFDEAREAIHCTNPLGFINGNSLIEPGYALVNLCVAYFSSSYNIFFFCHQFILLLLVLCGIFLLRNFVYKPEIFFLVYLLYLYVYSFSMLRQSLAIGVGMFAIHFFVKRKMCLFLAICTAAFFFHNSIMFFIPFYFLPILTKKFPQMNYELIGIVIGVIVYSFFPKFLSTLLTLGVVNAKYELYVNASFKTHKTNLIVYIVLWLIAFVYKKWDMGDTLKNQLIFTRFLCVIAFFIELCGVYNDIANRLTMYLFFLIITYLFNVIYATEKTNTQIKIFSCIIVIMMIVFFSYSGYVLKTSGLYPYKSQILGIH